MILSSCSATRYLNDDQALVRQASIQGVDEEFAEQAALYIQKDIRPNSRLNLALYNTFNTKNGAYRTGRIRKIGEAPHILDSSLVEISRTQIEKFLKSKGFFNATVKSDITLYNKKARILFTAQQGREYKVRNFEYEIADSAVADLYRRTRQSFSHIHPGKRYDADSLSREREQIFLMMKRNGYYDYVRQYVRFDVYPGVDSAQADLKLYLANPADKPGHQIYTINNSYITIKTSNGLTDSTRRDSVLIDSQYHFIDYSGKFRPGMVSKYIFLKKGDRYNLDKEELTYDRLYDLNVFKNIKIDFARNGDSTYRLNPIFEIIPLKKMSNRVEGEYTFNSGRNGFNIGDTYTNRNFLGGAEMLEVKAKYGIQFDATTSGNLIDRIFSRDFQVGVNFTLPKLWVPFRVPPFGKNGIPHTTISSSFQLFDQKDAFSNRVFINSLTYDWVETRYKFHSFTPINVEFRKGELDPAFRDSLDKKGFGLYIRTNDRQFFNLGSLYSYTLNTIRLNTYGNFMYFKGSIDAAGNLLGLMSNVLKLKEEDNFKTIFGLPYQQYVKTEVDLRFYRFFGGERQLVFRLNPGGGIPYGNSSTLSFEKQFFAGGSSGVRAWQARTLGPGSYNRDTLQDETTRRNLRNLDQLGELKLEGNLEYRFKIMDNLFGAKVKGATFTDFGNIWRLRKSNEVPGGQFDLSKFLGQLAIGTGAGLRLDYNYFVFRLDAGIKVKDPQFSGNKQWVIRYLFDKKDFKREYALRNSPDVYRFIQYNFGIGMPF